MYLVIDFYNTYKRELGLSLVGGADGLKRKIRKPELHRPGLGLAGYLKNFVSGRILVFGRGEIEYLKELSKETVKGRLQKILTPKTPAVILGHNHAPSKELLDICNQQKIPLFKANGSTMTVLTKLTLFLHEEFSPKTTIHATLVEVFGVGVLIQGNSSVGKSEAALGLLERGHRLITDDVVKVKKSKGQELIGSGPELTRHMMEIRGIGIINVAHLYGAVCVSPEKSLDVVVKLEPWDEKHYYDRVGTNKACDILGVAIPFHVLPVKPGRDVVLLIETIALNHRLRDMGYNSAKEFNIKLLKAISEEKSGNDDAKRRNSLEGSFD